MGDLQIQHPFALPPPPLPPLPLPSSSRDDPPPPPPPPFDPSRTIYRHKSSGGAEERNAKTLQTPKKVPLSFNGARR
ncbi:hypothetical protein ACS0TY_032462 [Phlomoides rotata]